jgi:hypothetical protein
MKRLILLFLMLSLFSCKPTRYTNYTTVCSCSEKEKAANFISSSIKNANNMSDEEMEDVISQLEYSAYNLYCHKKDITFDWDEGHRIMITKLDSCETVIF